MKLGLSFAVGQRCYRGGFVKQKCSLLMYIHMIEPNGSQGGGIQERLGGKKEMRDLRDLNGKRSKQGGNKGSWPRIGNQAAHHRLFLLTQHLN